MIVKHSADLPVVVLPNSALSGVQLTTKEDYGNFTVFEARIEAGATVPLKSADGERSVHFYYCITGKGHCRSTDGRQHHVVPDTVVALSSDVTYELVVSTESAMRLLVVYHPDAGFAYKSLGVVRHLSALIGTDRDIDFGNGHSRRYLIQRDDFPLGIHNTWVQPGTTSRLGYQNHVEGVYYISGQVTYRWQGTSGEWVEERSNTDAENGTSYLMEKHDNHILTSHDQDAYTICIFDPVLKGDENHQLTEDGFSGFGAS